MSLFEIIMCIVILGVMVGVAFLAFTFLSMLMPILDAICNFITWPIRKVGQGLRRLAEPVTSVLGSVRILSGGGVLFFLAALAFVVVYSVIICTRGQQIADVLELILYNTPMGAFLTMLQNGFDFSVAPAALVAAGFSGFLATVCMNRVAGQPWYIWCPCCLVFIAFSAIISSFCVDIFEAVGLWGVSTITGLSDATAGSGISTVFSYIALIVMGYLALSLLTLVIREYYACLCFGPISLAIFIVTAGILDRVIGTDNYTGPGYHWSEYVLLFLLFGVIMLAEYVRDRFEQEK